MTYKINKLCYATLYVGKSDTSDVIKLVFKEGSQGFSSERFYISCYFSGTLSLEMVTQ